MSAETPFDTKKAFLLLNDKHIGFFDGHDWDDGFPVVKILGESSPDGPDTYVVVKSEHLEWLVSSAAAFHGIPVKREGDHLGKAPE